MSKVRSFPTTCCICTCRAYCCSCTAYAGGMVRIFFREPHGLAFSHTFSLLPPPPRFFRRLWSVRVFSCVSYVVVMLYCIWTIMWRCLIGGFWIPKNTGKFGTQVQSRRIGPTVLIVANLVFTLLLGRIFAFHGTFLARSSTLKVIPHENKTARNRDHFFFWHFREPYIFIISKCPQFVLFFGRNPDVVLRSFGDRLREGSSVSGHVCSTPGRTPTERRGTPRTTSHDAP